MPFEVQTERQATHVRYDVSGPASLKNYFDLIDMAMRDTQEHGDVRGLVDLRGVGSRLSFTDQLFIGDVVGQKLVHLRRLAVVVPDAPESYNSPKVAIRKELDMGTFADDAAALAWLLGP